MSVYGKEGFLRSIKYHYLITLLRDFSENGVDREQNIAIVGEKKTGNNYNAKGSRKTILFIILLNMSNVCASVVCIFMFICENTCAHDVCAHANIKEAIFV